MRNYSQIISSILASLEGSSTIVDDANKEIDKFFKKPSFNWYPTYLAHDNKNFYMFSPFNASSYLDMNEFQEECSEASRLIIKLNGMKKKCIVFYISENNLDVIELKKNLPRENFGILHNEFSVPIIEYPLGSLSCSSDKLLTQPLDHIIKAKKLHESVAKILKPFAKKYSSSRRSIEDDVESIKNLIESLLRCDKRFSIGSKSIQFMKSIERFLYESKKNLRDHFFHACNTLMIGFVAMDLFYEKFSSSCLIYGENIIPEYLWIITALFHDIGYSSSLHTQIIVETFNVEEARQSIEADVRQMRQNLWNNLYQTIGSVLENLYSHITKKNKTPWEYDGFPHKIQNKAFLKSLEDSFVAGSHGASGVLILMSEIYKQIPNLDNSDDRKFLYRHVAIGALSILFHDFSVREVYRKNGISTLQIADFPIAGLLTYVDILQDDRRDLSGVITRPDVFKEVVTLGTAISAKLNMRIIDSSRGTKMYREFKEAFEFFVSNGISFVIPHELQKFA